MKKILITGGSGFLGAAIIDELIRRGGYEIVVMDMRPPRTPHPAVRFVKTNLLQPLPRDPNFKQPYGVINLAGKTIFGRWNKLQKTLIYTTRVDGTKHLVDMFADEKYRPGVLVSASAVGFYGDAGTAMCHEDAPVGKTYLSMVARDWEEAAWEAVGHNVRVTMLRNGHILDPNGGLLKTVLPLYRAGLGGPLGSGRQYFPWVSRADAARAYCDALENDWSGPVNVTSPQQLTNREFSHTLATVLGRPHIFRVPKFALRLLYGEFAKEITTSQKVYPGGLLKAGFDYSDPELASFLRRALSRAE